MRPSALYKEAHRLHYEFSNRGKALDLYKQLIERWPDSIEAGYAATQITNIEKDIERHGNGILNEGAGQRSAEESKILLTTAISAPGFDKYDVCGVVTSECAFGMNIVRDAFTSFTDVLGGRSKSTERVLRDASLATLRELEGRARELEADAVINVRFHFNEMSGKGKSMVFLVVTGTAIRQKTVASNSETPETG